MGDRAIRGCRGVLRERRLIGGSGAALGGGEARVGAVRPSVRGLLNSGGARGGCYGCCRIKKRTGEGCRLGRVRIWEA